MNTICDYIEKNIGGLFRCSRVGQQTRIRTPYLYPDGDVIDLFFAESENGAGTVSDAGETLRWLRMQTISQRKTAKQRQIIEDICLNHGVELYRGMLMVRVNSYEQIAESVMRLGQAALRVADLWFTFRNRMVETVTEEVEVFLTENHIPFDRNERIIGRSGHNWMIDFHTRPSRASSLICVLSTGSRAAAKQVTERTAAAWYDLNHLKVGPSSVHFVTLFDDLMDVWSPEDINLLSELSDVTFWSKPDEFKEKIAA